MEYLIDFIILLQARRNEKNSGGGEGAGNLSKMFIVQSKLFEMPRNS